MKKNTKAHHILKMQDLSDIGPYLCYIEKHKLYKTTMDEYLQHLAWFILERSHLEGARKRAMRKELMDHLKQAMLENTEESYATG